MRLFLSLTILALFVFTGLPIAQANVKQLKVYRKVYPNFKPKCNYCHVDAKPKKDDGKHDLNAYGAKMQELMNGEALTEEMLQTLGNHEDFEAQQEASDSEEMSATTDTNQDIAIETSPTTIMQETKDMLIETREMVADTKDMVEETHVLVAETAATTKELNSQVQTLIAGVPQEMSSTPPEELAAE